MKYETSDLDLLITYKKGSRIDKILKHKLGVFLYKNLDQTKFSLLHSDYGIKIALIRKGGFLAIVDIGLHEKNQEKYDETDFEDNTQLNEFAKRFFGVSYLRVIKLESYKKILLKILDEFLTPDSNQLRVYRHKLHRGWISCTIFMK